MKKVESSSEPGAAIRLPIFQSMEACEAVTGIPRHVLRKAKADGSDAFDHARVNLGKLLRFLFRPKSDEPAQLPVASAGGGRGEYEVYRAAREKIRLQKDLELTIEKPVVQADIQEAMGILFSTLDRVFLSELPIVQEGMKAAQLRESNRREIESIKSELRDIFERLTKEIESSSESTDEN